MTLARRFLVRRVDVRNCTGYGHYVTGDANDFSEMASDGAWEDCRAANCEIHFEQMFSEHITLINCHSRDGEGDLNCHSWFHPVVGSRNILYLGCSGRGRAGAGIEATANVRDLERIRFVACDIHVTTGTTALVTSAGVGRTDGLELIATRIRSELGIGAQLHNTEASAVQCSISGHGEALQVRNGSLLTATSTDVLGVADADAGNTAIGVNLDATSHVRWIGGSIEALGQARQRVPIYGAVANAEISDSTRIVPGRLRVYKVQEIYGLASIQQDGATTAFANIVVPAPVSNVDRAHLDFSIRKSADRYTADKIGASWSWMNNQTIRVRLAGDGTLPATAKLAYHFVEWGERP